VSAPPPEPPEPDVLRQACACYGRADFAAAEALFRRALARDPGCVPALGGLGLALQALGKGDEALATHEQARRLHPHDPEVLGHLGITLASLGRHGQALQVFDEALALSPCDAALLTNRAVAYNACRGHEAAEADCWAALALDPDLPQAHNNLGNALRHQGRIPEAEPCYRRALALAPAFPEALANLGELLLHRGEPAEACDLLGRLGRARPTSRSHTLHGRALLAAARKPEALAALREAVRLDPADAEAHNDLGNARAAAGDLAGAVSAYGEAERLRPGWAAPHYNRGLALQGQGLLAEGRACFAEALELEPDNALTHATAVGTLHYLPDLGPDEILREHRLWAQRHTKDLPPPEPHANHPDPDRRVRVGYVSPDFRRHAVAFFLEPVLRRHDPQQVEVFCYAEVPAPDEMTRHFQSLAGHWRPTCGLSDEQLAAQVRADGIDLLVDLAGHLAGNRLRAFAWRPAPVQLSWLGYPGTTGLDAVAYRLTDDVADPPGEEAFHGEELVRLPGPFCCYRPPHEVPPFTALPSRARGHLTFGSLHKLEKLNDAVLALWAEVLHAVPDSHLLICRNTLRGATAEALRNRISRQGIPQDRVEMRAVEPVSLGHLHAYADIDVLLDTFPWCGHTTACEALSMGVPVVTLRGDRHAGRMTASVLSRLALEDLIAPDPRDYVRVAAGLARDLPRRAVLRGSLRGRMLSSPLCDAPAFTRNLEATYRCLWQRWCASSPKGGAR
jgi:protein O-GlcNAc transferase